MDKKFKFYLAKITWVDSAMRHKVWWTPTDIFESIDVSEREDYIVSAGYVFRETEKNYWMANSISFEEGKPVAFGEIFSIPKGCVIKLFKVK